jgi:hypothetical protein
VGGDVDLRLSEERGLGILWLLNVTTLNLYESPDNPPDIGAGVGLRSTGVLGSEMVRQTTPNGVAFGYQLMNSEEYQDLHAAGLGANNALSETPLSCIHRSILASLTF